MPKLYITRYYRRDRGTKFGWKLVGFDDGVELARINPKFPAEKDAIEAFTKLFRALAGGADWASWSEGDILSQAEGLDV